MRNTAKMLSAVYAYYLENQQLFFFLAGMLNVVKNAVHTWKNVQYAGAQWKIDSTYLLSILHALLLVISLHVSVTSTIIF